MSRERSKEVGPFGLTVGALVIALIIVSVVYANVMAKRRAQRVQNIIDRANYISALQAYSNHFGVLPVGGNATVTAALAGSNVEHLVFLKLGQPSKLNSRGEFLDPYARPYDIEVTTNRIRIAPRPQ